VFTPEQVAEAKAQFQAALERNYQFSEEEALGLQTEPEKVIPRLAAKLHAEILGDVMRQIQQTVPNMIQGVQASNTRETKAKDEFYGAWPELRSHEDKVIAVGKMFREMNPTASPQEAIKQIGRLTMVALGKDVAVQNAPPPPAKASFQPAATGRVASPAPAKSEWEQLIELDDD
jgi:hypothetical protein